MEYPALYADEKNCSDEKSRQASASDKPLPRCCISQASSSSSSCMFAFHRICLHDAATTSMDDSPSPPCCSCLSNDTGTVTGHVKFNTSLHLHSACARVLLPPIVTHSSRNLQPPLHHQSGRKPHCPCRSDSTCPTP